MKTLKVAPSLLSLDFSMMSEQLDILKDSDATYLHYDVMDAHFVPNLTFGHDVLKGIQKRTNKPVDVHIMVSDPMFVSDLFLPLNIEFLTFHYEACKDEKHCFEVIKKIKNSNTKVGMSIKPNTPISVLLPFLSSIDLILVMSVEPGFGGQSFLPSALHKIEELDQLRIKNNYQYVIEVDGGINLDTAKQCKEKGVDIVVAGSYVFKENIQEKIKWLRQL